MEKFSQNLSNTNPGNKKYIILGIAAIVAVVIITAVVLVVNLAGRSYKGGVKPITLPPSLDQQKKIKAPDFEGPFRGERPKPKDVGENG